MPKEKVGIVGVHNLALVDIDTKETAAILKVVDSANIDLGESVAKMKGGDSNFPYSVAIVDCNDTVTVPVREFPDNFMGLVYHGTQTSGTAETTGNIADAVNVTGTSVVAATGILAAITKTASPAVLKEGIYIAKAAAAATLNFYGYSDFDDLVESDDESGLVNATPYTISIGGTVAITELGITVTGGASATAFTPGDTAIIVIRKVNAGYINTPIADTKLDKYYKAYLMFQPSPEGHLDYIELYRVKVSRGAHNAAIKEYHSQELTLNVTKDSANSNLVGNWHKTKG
jgi:hypothetical protein